MGSSILSLIIFILALGGMIFVHELGHFLAARWAKIEVEEFGFGLPSYKIATLFTWQGTEFTLHALPLGGFVRPKGENDPNIPGGYGAASPWKRLVVLIAGPLMNLLTAVIVFTALVANEGIPVPGSVRIESVAENSPAEEADIHAGDIIVSINGQEVTDIEPARSLIRENLDIPVEFVLNRDGELITIVAMPLSSRIAEEGALGVGLNYPTRPATLIESVQSGVTITGLQAAAIVSLPIALIQGAIAPGEARLIGFKGIYDLFNFSVQEDVTSRQEAAEEPTASGADSAPQPTNFTISLIGLLSVSLGVFNLLPIPALDGGRILFTLPEILFKKRIPTEWENMVNGIAMLLLIGLMVFVNVMDFINPAQIVP
ncbi:MAG: site-2 protease family protein [Anaerolineales bacterium]|jgi:regulator of sigma E protease|nr:site-2 protease family protein [Anaerolineales bacterium]